MEFELGPETERQIDHLYSTLEESMMHLKKVRENLWKEIKAIKGIAGNESDDYRELVFSLGNIGKMLTDQFERIRDAIKWAMALPVCVFDIPSEAEKRGPVLSLKS